MSTLVFFILIMPFNLYLVRNQYTDLIPNTVKSIEKAKQSYQTLGKHVVLKQYQNLNKTLNLLSIGTKHVYIIKSKVIEDIREQFEEYKPDLVLIEGWFDLRDNDAYKSKIRKTSLEKFQNPVEMESIIKNRGEFGYVVMLASFNNIEIDTLEPFRIELKKELINKFSKEEYFITEVIISLGIKYNNTTQTKRVFDLNKETFQNMIPNLQKWIGDDSFNFSFDNFIDLKNKLLGLDFDLSNQAEIISYTKAFQHSRNIVDTIMAEETNMRDIVMFNVIKEKLESGKYKRVMTVTGGAHVITQEPALRKLFETLQFNC